MRKDFYKRGLFLGPQETREAFLRRVESLTIPVNPVLESAKDYFHSLFGATPDWIPLVVDKQGLSFWEAAATWIEEEPNATRTCQIQLKRLHAPFSYSQEEILSHEMVHATRLMFNEPRFEEILAYQTSKIKWRRYFGPLFRSAKETTLLLVLSALSWVLYMAELFLDTAFFSETIFILPCAFLLVLLIRLIRSQILFSKALLHLKKTLKNPEEALGTLLRLSDKQIEQCAHGHFNSE